MFFLFGFGLFKEPIGTCDVMRCLVSAVEAVISFNQYMQFMPLPDFFENRIPDQLISVLTTIDVAILNLAL